MDERNPARLRIQPTRPTRSVEPGLHPLGLSEPRDGLLYLPDAPGPRPLLVALHGATMHAKQMVPRLLAAADEAGVALLVPDSRGPTWDIVLGGYGPDIAFLGTALAAAFDRCEVDPEAISLGGISDGASYALSLGLANGDQIDGIVALSAGFAAPPELVGKPRVFQSHGIHDTILPIDGCGRPIAVGLRNSGYDLEYVEFDGGHEMPEPVVRAAFQWLVGPPS